MSTRQLRKLQKQRELGESTHHDSEESDDAEETAPVTGKPRINLFAALGGDDESGAQDHEEEEEEQPDDADAHAEKESGVSAGSKKSKNKKKKKKSKKAKAAPAAGDVEPSGEDEIDKAMRELKIQPQRQDAASPNSASASGPHDRLLLTINPYHLKAVNEMRNLFGRDVMEAVDAEEEQEHRGGRRRAVVQRNVDLETFLREPPGAPKLPEVSLRRNVFIQGKEHWPLRTPGGLSMKEMQKAPDGSWTEYAYAYDQEYDATQAVFFACVQIGDPMRMVHLLKSVPYHVSTLLQVSSVAKQDQNMALAAELCERALFTFGRVATSAFRQNLEQGKARLDFKRPENRQLWLAGYQYLKSLIRKGTYRTALEWAKLLYSLDPEDPYAMRHFIHSLAIRAYESSWLVDFLGQLEKMSGKDDTIYIQQSRVLARLQMGDAEQARKDLIDGMQQLPWLYCALFQELHLDAPPSIWGISADSDARSFWTKLYIYQTKDSWDNAQATALLQDVAKSISRVNVAALPKDDPPVDRGSTRLVYLEGATSLLSAAPRDILDSQPNYESDPLPPPEDENIFTNESTKLPWASQHQDERQQGPGRLGNILAQMQEMLPRRRRPDGLDVPEGGEGDLQNFDGLDIDMDDEELRQDIAEHIASHNEPGMLADLLNMFGIGTSSGGGGEDGDTGPGHINGLPGAWPDDYDDGDRHPNDSAGR